MTEQQQPPPVNVDDDWEDDTPQEEETQYETQPPEILNGDIEHIDAEQQIPQAGSKAGRDQLLMRFCPHDSSMLYPKEDRRTMTLRHACRLCPYTEASSTPLIFQSILKKEVVNALHTVPSAISDDPTLPRSHKVECESCRNNEAVFFQSDNSDVRSDSLALIFVCCNCDHKWVG
mmetsp:Transcript_29379/g.33803  ORF Transcript_29379/g.33803 Transcript_29379/m.33803 type:complete len:175 (+) Transcript_29379:53-577(+)|eukprot:CAMPEP_0194356200 /NCGR_PEP_ID=MMETSP0174-20130528/3934_1 /TAXON_ID=216777 /ORGANISM="Proboscia alata, Strain PI-D3" /LENGTH=174 /DNA_ID=CAMNT_0039125721 /DNA_START=49 /DNA_END=573 /DNA_ORIENTATION=+